MDAADGIPEQFVAAAGMVRHLPTDPVLPDDLLPAGWPGREYRDSYAEFAEMLMHTRVTEAVWSVTVEGPVTTVILTVTPATPSTGPPPGAL